MAWTGLALTVDGRNALNLAQISGKMSIKSIVVGDGTAPANFSTQKDLVHRLYEITELKVDPGDGECTVTADIPWVDYDYYFREIGVIVATGEGEALYVYDNCGDSAQYIVSTTGVESTRKRIRLLLRISDVAEITVVNAGILLYVAYDEYRDTVERLETGIGENRRAVEEHLADTDNPHEVTQAQVGLGNADNTADMDKPVSTAQQAALDDLYEQMTAYTKQKIADLINGAPESLDTLKEVSDAIAAHKTVMDALNEAIGKKANAAEFDSHIKDAIKHITSTERTAWNGKLDPTGDASNVTATFSQASSRANLTSREKLSVSLGKIMKWFADLTNGAASTLLGTNLTANRAVVSNGSGKLAVSAVTSTELGYLDGVTSNVQSQLNELNTGLGNKAPSNHSHSDYYPKSGGTVNGHVNAGGKVQIWTDDEGGNIHLTGGDGTDWEIDAYNGALRIFTYANGVKTGIAIGQSGKVHFPSGAADIDWGWIINKPTSYTPAAHRHAWSELTDIPDIGGYTKQHAGYIGYHNTIYGCCEAIGIGARKYIINIAGKQMQQNSTESFDWGFNLSGILNALGLDSGLTAKTAVFTAFSADGLLLTNYLGYGASLTNKTVSAGGVATKILRPGRYHSAAGDYGNWDNHSALGQNGVFWDVRITVG